MKRQDSRRDFLKQTGFLAAAGTVLAGSMVPKVHAAENNIIKIAFVGCGNRGMGAANQALSADPNLKLWAVADVFPDKSQGAVKRLKAEFEKKEKGHMVDVAPERTFDGFDAYKKAMDALNPGDVVLLTTPPAFRPLHYAYAVEKGLNVFAEKPLAVDIPGLKSLRETNVKAKEKGLKVAVGLNNRHYFRTEETVKAIQDGKLGELYSFFVYRCHPAHKISPRGNRTPLQMQLRHIFNFNWTTGGFIVDALIHNLDICCWANQQLPVAALGIGGRLFRRDKDDLIDNATVQYTFADGKKMHMFSVTMDGTWNGFRAIVHGSKGSAMLGEGVADPRFFSDWKGELGKDPFWSAEAEKNNSYQTEHDRFFKAIRENQPWNELDRGIDATFTPILGRMAIETGKYVTSEEAWNSTFQCVPNVAELSFDGNAPIMPDENGDYPIAIPGKATLDNPYNKG